MAIRREGFSQGLVRLLWEEVSQVLVDLPALYLKSKKVK
jgi:hypothetical protein